MPKIKKNKKTPDGVFLVSPMIKFGGDGGIRTHVPGLADNLISSQAQYDLFGTSPKLSKV